jgi:hypothetical protein
VKLILAQPATQRFRWELDVLLTNIRQFTDMEVVLLFTEHDFTVPIHFRNDWGCSVFVYTDKRDDGSYIPSVRPWLLWQYFAEDSSREQETYFYIDSDVIFREWIDFATLDIRPETIVGSNVSGYLDYKYVAQCQQGDTIAAQMAEVCGITVEQMKNVPGIGAHLIFSELSADFWKRCYFDSNKLWHYFEGLDSNIQKWTAEMWAQQWGWIREGKTLLAPAELDFCMATDEIEKYDAVKIMHNAGVTAEKSYELFFKGQYVNYAPFGKSFDFVRRDKCSYEYVKAIQKVVNK